MTAAKLHPVAPGIVSGGVDDGQDSASSASLADPAVSEGQLSFPEIRPPVRLAALHLDKPVEILQRCKTAALKADVSLRWWHEFRSTAAACLSPDCEPEEMTKFLVVVRERFSVETY